jgi:hypothetical protein
MCLAERALMWLTTGDVMSKSMLAEIDRLRQMTVGELRVKWRELYREESRSRNRDFLWRRLAWRVQELALGGLSDRAKARIAELAPPDLEFTRARVPADFKVPEAPVATPPPKTTRDARLPVPGTVITRTWHGRDLRLTVLADGYELDGTRYGSLSEAARAATGAHWNGKLFWGVVQRNRKK